MRHLCASAVEWMQNRFILLDKQIRVEANNKEGTLSIGLKKETGQKAKAAISLSGIEQE